MNNTLHNVECQNWVTFTPSTQFLIFQRRNHIVDKSAADVKDSYDLFISMCLHQQSQFSEEICPDLAPKAMCTYDDSCPCATALNRQYFFKEQLFLVCSFNSIVCKYQPESGIKKEMIFLMLFMIFTVSQWQYSCFQFNTAVCAADSNQVTITRHKGEINTLLQ